MEYPLILDMDDFQEPCDRGKFQTKFYLIGVIDVFGSTNGHMNGKYFACTLREGQWYRFGDEVFTKITEEQALKR